MACYDSLSVAISTKLLVHIFNLSFAHYYIALCTLRSLKPHDTHFRHLKRKQSSGKESVGTILDYNENTRTKAADLFSQSKQ